jgi:hypothetical protein
MFGYFFQLFFLVLFIYVDAIVVDLRRCYLQNRCMMFCLVTNYVLSVVMGSIGVNCGELILANLLRLPSSEDE